MVAAIAAEVIPEVDHKGTPLGILLGFAAGGLVMIALKWVVLRFEKREEKLGKRPVGLAAAAGLDALIDGAIISAGFTAGPRVGALLAIALAVELASLTLSVGSEFHKGARRTWAGLATTTGISLLLPVGAFGAGAFLAGASDRVVAEFLAFGAAALLYLVAAELLVESIEAEENLFSTAMLFAGFLGVLALKVLGR